MANSAFCRVCPLAAILRAREAARAAGDGVLGRQPASDARHHVVELERRFLSPKKPIAKPRRSFGRLLAKLHRAGELMPIWIPDAAHETMRDLVRARATAVGLSDSED